MSILGGIKDRLLRRNEAEIDDLRSHILGQAQQMPDPEPPKKLYEREPSVEDVKPFDFENERGFEGRGSLGIGVERDTVEVSKNYEIMDKLNMIDAQLSAIRSQTETINERLKNLELRLQGRRL